ncbi:MAG: L-fucose/L-arabinose isomerase family protein [Anaerolineae bacterium]
MRSTPIGLVLLNDERPHVTEQNEALNVQVLQRWAQVIRDGLVFADGSRPELVIIEHTVTSPRVAQEAGERLRRAGVRSLVMCYNVWNFPFMVWPLVRTLGMDVPILSLSNNNGKFPGNVGLLATDGALRQAGVRTHRIVGEIDDKATCTAVIDWLRAAQAMTTMRGEVYGLYGGHSMGMETGYFHLVPTIKAFGTTTQQIDQLMLVERMKSIDPAEVTRGRKWFESLLGDRLRYDGKMLTEATLETQLRLYLAMESVNQEKGFDFCGLKGQRELTEYVCLGDVPEMLMNDPYDWRGPKEPVVCATEADAFAAITMQVLKYMSGGLPTLFMDVRLYHPDRDLWDWCNSGNHASWYAKRSYDPAENFSKVTLWPALEFYFKAGGASVEFDAAPGRMTFARAGLWDDKPYMVIVGGEAVELPPAESAALKAQTDPTWPHVWAKLDCSFDEFTTVFPANHAQGVSGDYVRALTWYCEMNGITPIVLGPKGQQRIAPVWERVQ